MGIEAEAVVADDGSHGVALEKDVGQVYTCPTLTNYLSCWAFLVPRDHSSQPTKTATALKIEE